MVMSNFDLEIWFSFKSMGKNLLEIDYRKWKNRSKCFYVWFIRV